MQSSGVEAGMGELGKWSPEMVSCLQFSASSEFDSPDQSDEVVACH